MRKVASVIFDDRLGQFLIAISDLHHLTEIDQFLMRGVAELNIRVQHPRKPLDEIAGVRGGAAQDFQVNDEGAPCPSRDTEFTDDDIVH